MGWLAAAVVAMLMAITPATATSPAVRGTAFQLVEQHPLPSVCQPGSRVRGVDVGTRKIVAFSFDDGPWPSYTERIMASFESRGLRATFFMVASTSSHTGRSPRRYTTGDTRSATTR